MMKVLKGVSSKTEVFLPHSVDLNQWKGAGVISRKYSKVVNTFHFEPVG